MAILPVTLKEIAAQVRSGCEERDRIIEIFREEMYEPGELDPSEVELAVDAAFADLEAEKGSWPEVTDCDRLDAAFEKLNQRGIIALQNAGYTQSDGCDDCSQVYHEHPDKKRIIGYCFYHGQDLERAVAGEGLYLAFGPNSWTGRRTNGGRRITTRRVSSDLGWNIQKPHLHSRARLETALRRAREYAHRHKASIAFSNEVRSLRPCR